MNLIRAFFPKSGHFSLNFEKEQGRPPAFPLAVTHLHFKKIITQYFLVVNNSPCFVKTKPIAVKYVKK